MTDQNQEADNGEILNIAPLFVDPDFQQINPGIRAMVPSDQESGNGSLLQPQSDALSMSSTFSERGYACSICLLRGNGLLLQPQPDAFSMSSTFSDGGSTIGLSVNDQSDQRVPDNSNSKLKDEARYDCLIEETRKFIDDNQFRSRQAINAFVEPRLRVALSLLFENDYNEARIPGFSNFLRKIMAVVKANEPASKEEQGSRKDDPSTHSSVINILDQSVSISIENLNFFSDFTFMVFQNASSSSNWNNGNFFSSFLPKKAVLYIVPAALEALEKFAIHHQLQNSQSFQLFMLHSRTNLEAFKLLNPELEGNDTKTLPSPYGPYMPLEMQQGRNDATTTSTMDMPKSELDWQLEMLNLLIKGLSEEQRRELIPSVMMQCSDFMKRQKPINLE